jgi:TIR domain/SIR2-like domain
MCLDASRRVVTLDISDIHETVLILKIRGAGLMQLRDWKRFFNDLPRLDDLIERVSVAEPTPVFMVGAGLSSAEEIAGPGVPSTEGMVELVRHQISSDILGLGELDRRLREAEEDGTPAYSAAFEFLQRRRGQDAVNGLVRAAVLQARVQGARRLDDPAELERDLDGWALSRGTRALGVLLTEFPQIYPGPVLTTNFDPLLCVAIRKAGGRPRRVIFDEDGRLPSGAEADADEVQVVYLHGYWRGSDTHHTGTELTASRPRLDASLARLLDRRLVVVAGYGGWDDAFMKAVSSLLEDADARPDIVWALHDDNPGMLFDNHAALMDHFDQWRVRSRFTLFAGIDANDFFEQLLDGALATAGLTAKTASDNLGTAEDLPRQVEASIGSAATSGELARSIPSPQRHTLAGFAPSPSRTVRHDQGSQSTTTNTAAIRKKSGDVSESAEGANQSDQIDFFVSYTSPDRAWAEWIAWQLEDFGYSTAIQAWDSLPGYDFVVWMDRAIRRARHVLIVLSPDYEEAASFTLPEWSAAIGRDPTGEHAVLFPVRVSDFAPGGFFRTRVWVDLAGKDEKAARTALLQGVQQRRLKPATEPPFPAAAGAPPSSVKQERWSSSQSSLQPPFPGPDPVRRLCEAIRELRRQSAEIRSLLPITRARRIPLTMILPAVQSNLETLKCADPAEWPGDTTWAAKFSTTLSDAVEQTSYVTSELERERSPQVVDLLDALDQLCKMACNEYEHVLPC